MITVRRKLSVTLMLIRSATKLSVHCITVTAVKMTMLSDAFRCLNFNVADLLSVMSKQFLTFNSVYYYQYISANVQSILMKIL